MANPLTPGDKKLKSLKRDCPNRYGQNDKASRLGIRRRKANASREFRRRTKQVLADPSEDYDSLGEQVELVAHNNWRKVPDTALSDHLRNKTITEVFNRISAATNPEDYLNELEAELINSGAPRPSAVQSVRQIRAKVFSPSASIQIDFRTATEMLRILNRIRPS